MEKYLNLFKYFSIFLPNQVLDAKKKSNQVKKKKKTGQVLEVSSTGIFLLFFTFWKKVLCTSMLCQNREIYPFRLIRSRPFVALHASTRGKMKNISGGVSDLICATNIFPLTRHVWPGPLQRVSCKKKNVTEFAKEKSKLWAPVVMHKVHNAYVYPQIVKTPDFCVFLHFLVPKNPTQGSKFSRKKKFFF